MAPSGAALVILVARVTERTTDFSPPDRVFPDGRPGQPFRPDQIYVPTWVEWGVLIGLASFVGLAITLGVRYLVLHRGRHEAPKGRPSSSGR